MKMVFCTLFDSNYLSRGLTLYYSLERVCPEFHLYIFAFDERSDRVLRALNLPHATIVPLREFEDERLLAIKGTRSRAEYCWTCTSSTILHVLERYQEPMCTYLDADMMFFSSPQPLFDELGSDSVIITEHRYTPRYDKSILSGKYCVQFVTFRRDERGLKALRWWRERCLEWCYARYEDGKFGDQLYLDDWTDRFEGIHVLRHLGGGMAAWNVQQYRIHSGKNGLVGREIKSGEEFDVIFYHFHYVRFFVNGLVDLGRRVLSEEAKSLLYVSYLKELERAKQVAAGVDASFDSHGASPRTVEWKTPILYLYRKMFGIYNVARLQRILEA
ncbi:MAG: glycosyl transferase [Ignavibacteriales bacterium]|nr:glycosyl transferase [Ignavibacteriales bacterium]